MNLSGKYKTNLSRDAEYKSFSPTYLPLDRTFGFDDETIQSLVNARTELARLDMLTSKIPNMNLFMTMYVKKEALLTSQIEGTQATLEDVLDPMIDENTNLNIRDVINYIHASEYAIDRLNTLPLCNRLIKEAHAELMKNVRGQEKNPGKFRTSQNWIGPKGSTLKNARYIPPNPEDMKQAMGNLENYMNEESGVDVLIRTALVHYQFETIHPFLDGNGRVGRLLIILMLMHCKVLSKPVLYISYFLKKNRTEYYDKMMEVREKGNYDQWIVFFLEAIYESAKDAIANIERLEVLHNKVSQQIAQMGRLSKNARVVFEYLESNPIIEIKKTSKDCNLTYNTVSHVVTEFCDMGILNKVKNVSRNRIFIFSEYVAILKDGIE
ncbi:Fic family protein [Anaerorhabdus sp.]|uniref:Fic family protein n=1 Tax=Anaerorhabdus sp. TaxID=1872524 RepID=UPI002FCA00CB